MTQDEIIRNMQEAKAAGCPADQIERFLQAGIVLQPRQLAMAAAARECDKPNGPTSVLVGGARGGAKSHWMICQLAADDCQRVNNLKCLWLRKVGKANIEHLNDLRHTALAGVPHEFRQQDGIMKFKNGSRIICGHFENENDIDAYLGLEYDIIAIEEATTLTWTKYRNIRSCNRSSKPGWRPRDYNTANPGGVGHCIPHGDVLTPDGWKPIESLHVGNAVYTVTPNGEMVEGVVDQVHASIYRGRMANIRQRGLSIECTPEHKLARLLDRRKNTGLTDRAFELTKADKLPGSAKLLRSVSWQGEEVPDFHVPPLSSKWKLKNRQPDKLHGDHWCELMGWFLSEGCAVFTEKHRFFTIAQMKPRGRAKIALLLQICGFKFCSDSKSFTVHSARWAHYFMQFGRSRDKFIPTAILRAPPVQLRLFFNAMVNGDGHWAGEEGDNGQYYTISDRLADDMQQVALKLGYIVSVHRRQRENRFGQEIRVNFKKTDDGCSEILTGNHVYKVSTKVKRPPDLTWSEYHGPVFCIGVGDTHTFIVRQNGCVWISGNSWVKQRFVVPFAKPTPGQTEKYRTRPDETIFVPALCQDNKFNNDDYIHILEGFDGWQRRAWLEGDWDIAAGQFFTTWRENIHVLQHFDDKKGVEWFAAMDYGFQHYNVWHLACQTGEGDIVIVDEIAERQKLPSWHAAQIRSKMAYHNLTEMGQLSNFFASPDMWGTESDGANVAADYADLGMNLEQAENDRVSGWAAMLRLLGDPERGKKPKLFVHQRCRKLIEQLPMMQHDPKRPEDCLKVHCDEDGNGGDDAVDCARYLICSKRGESAATPWARAASVGSWSGSTV